MIKILSKYTVAVALITIGLIFLLLSLPESTFILTTIAIIIVPFGIYLLVDTITDQVIIKKQQEQKSERKIIHG